MMHDTLSELRDLCDEAEALEARILARAGGSFGLGDERLALVHARAGERFRRRLRKLYPPKPYPVDVRPTEGRSW